MNWNSLSRNILLVGTVLGLSACGGEGNSTKVVNSYKGSLIGYYIDSEVVGLPYECGNTVGTTGSNGEFFFDEGDECRLFLDQDRQHTLKVLPEEVLVDEVVIIETDPVITQTLQSLDSDGDPDNGITIDQEVVTAVVEDPEFVGVPTTQAEAEVFVEVIDNNNGDVEVVTAESAQGHVLETVLTNSSYYQYCSGRVEDKAITKIDFANGGLSLNDASQVATYNLNSSNLVITDSNGTSNSFVLIQDDDSLIAPGDSVVIESSAGARSTLHSSIEQAQLSQAESCAFGDNTAPTISLTGLSEQTIAYGADYLDAGATASDDVDGSVDLVVTNSVDINALGASIVTYNAVDSSGNIAETVTRTVIVADQTSPVISLLGASSINIAYGSSYTDPGATATDNVDSDVTVEVSGSVDTNNVGSYSLTYLATDVAGNSAVPATRTVFVVDQAAPVINLNGQSSFTIAHGSVYNDAGATAADNVDSDVVVKATNTVDTNAVGSYTVTYAATDAAGNVATPVTRTVLVTDQTAPVISLVGETPLTIAHGSTYTDAGATATDNVDSEVSIDVTNTVDTNAVGSYTVTYAATDAAGNVATPVTRTVLVTDQTAPVISLVGDTPLTIAHGSTYSDAGATATDNVDSDVVVDVTNTVDTNAVGSYTVTYAASDAAGNAATPVTRTVLVTDQTAPVISLVGDTPLTIAHGSTYSDAGATATDNVDSDVSIDVTNTVDTTAIGSYTVTYAATDAAGNVATPVTRTVLVTDQTAPVISLVGDTPLTIAHGSTYSDAGATATDNVDSEVSIDVTNTVDTSAVGSYIVTYAATDAAGNVATPVTRNVLVTDQTAPVLTLLGESTVTVGYGSYYEDEGVLVVDAVDEYLEADVEGSYIDTYNLDTYTVTYNATDAAGNSAEPISRAVIVADIMPPEIELYGDAEVSVTLNTPFNDEGYYAWDDVDYSVDVVVTGDVDTSVLGEYELVYSASDNAGNTSEVTRVVSVIDDRLTLNLPETYYHFSEPSYMTEVLIGIDSITHRSGNLESGEIDYYNNDYVLSVASRLVDGVFIDNDYINSLVLSEDNKSIIIEDFVEMSLSNETDIEGKVFAHGMDYRQMQMPASAKEYTANYRLIEDLYVLNYEVYDYDTYDTYDTYGNYASFDELIENNCDDSSAQGLMYLDNGWSVRFNCTDASQQSGELIGYDPSQAYDSTQGEKPVVVVGQWERFTLPDSDLEALGILIDPEYQSNAEIQKTPIFVVRDGGVWSGYKQDAQTAFTDSLQYLNAVAYQALLEASASTPPPVIELIGPSELEISNGGDYTEFGATAVDSEGVSVTPTVSGSIESGINGTYIITYEAQDSEGNVSTPVERTIYVVDDARPTIFLVGDNYLNIPEGESFVDPGVIALDGFGQELPVTVEGEVDTDTIGEYYLSYSVVYDEGNRSSSVSRYVYVTDSTPPVIQLIGDSSVTVAHASNYVDEGVTVTDNVDGSDVYWYSDDYVDTYTVGTYIVTYNAYDYAGNNAVEVTRTVEVVDQTPPEIMVIGEETEQVTLNTVFTDQGVVASDSVDDTVEYTVQGEVDTSVPGDYELLYTASDSAGNTVEFTRTVTVIDDRLALSLPETFYKFYVPNYMTEMTLGLEEVTFRSGDLDSGVIDYYLHDSALYIPSRFVDGVFVENDGVHPLLLSDDGKSVIVENIIEISLSNETDIEGVTYKHGNDYRPMVMPAEAKEFTANYHLTQDLYALTSQYYNYENSVDSYEPYTSFEGLIADHCESESALSELYLRNNLRVRFDCSDANESAGDLIGFDPYYPELGSSVIGEWEQIVLPGSDVSALLFSIDPEQRYSYEQDSQNLYILKDDVIWRGYKQDAGATFKDSDQYFNEVAYQALLDASASPPPPVIELIGPSDVYVNHGGVYTEFGATAVDREGVAVIPVASGSVDTETYGTYVITYEAQDSDGNVSVPVERYVYVEDYVSPTVFLLGERYIDIPEGGTFVDPGVTAVDGFGQPVSVLVNGTVDTSTIGEYYLDYYTLDDQGNESYVEYRYVSVSDTTPPVIQLIGESTITIAQGSTYEDQGVSVSDNVDGDEVYWYSSEYVDTYNTGTYYVEYYAYDNAGNETTLTRTVEVVDLTAPVITLFGEQSEEVTLNTTYTDKGAEANDNVDDFVEVSVVGEVDTSVLGEYELVYSATDSAGNTTEETRIVSVSDDRLALNLPETFYHFSPPAYMTEVVMGVDTISYRSGDLERGVIDYYDDNYALSLPDHRLIDGVFSENYYEYEENDLSLVLSEDGKSVVVGDFVEISISNETDIEGVTVEHGYDYRAMVMPFGAKEYTANYSLTKDLYVLNSQYYGYNYTDYSYTSFANFDEFFLGNCTDGASIDGISLLDGWTVRFNCEDAGQESGDLIGFNDWDYNAASVVIGDWERVTLPDSDIQAVVFSIDSEYRYSDEIERSVIFVEQDGQLFEGYKQSAGSPLKLSETYLNDVAYQALLEASASTPPPVIELIGPSDISISRGGVYTEFGATAFDAEGVEVTPSASGSVDTSANGTYVITYEAQDAEGNVSTPVERIVHVVDSADPTGFLLGERYLDASLGESFVDPGIIALDGYGQPMSVTVQGEVDTNTIGEYYLTYYFESEDSLYYFEEYRYVSIRDTTPPIIELVGDSNVKVAYGDSYVDEGVIVTDDVDGDDVYWYSDEAVDTYTLGTYTITYYAYDYSDNEAIVTRTVEVVDETPPVITVYGEELEQVALNEEYVDAGAVVNDNTGESISLVVEGTVNTEVEGDYELTYSATDSSGNTALVTRVVTVFNAAITFNLPVNYYYYPDASYVTEINITTDKVHYKSGKLEYGVVDLQDDVNGLRVPDNLVDGVLSEGGNSQRSLVVSEDNTSITLDNLIEITLSDEQDIEGLMYEHDYDYEHSYGYEMIMPFGAKEVTASYKLVQDIYVPSAIYQYYDPEWPTFTNLDDLLNITCGPASNIDGLHVNGDWNVGFACDDIHQESGLVMGAPRYDNSLEPVVLGNWNKLKLPNSDMSALILNIDPEYLIPNSIRRKPMFVVIDDLVWLGYAQEAGEMYKYSDQYLNLTAYQAIIDASAASLQ